MAIFTSLGGFQSKMEASASDDSASCRAHRPLTRAAQCSRGWASSSRTYPRFRRSKASLRRRASRWWAAASTRRARQPLLSGPGRRRRQRRSQPTPVVGACVSFRACLQDRGADAARQSAAGGRGSARGGGAHQAAGCVRHGHPRADIRSLERAARAQIVPRRFV